MITLSIGNVDMSEYITKITFESSPDTRESKTFTNYDGTIIGGAEGRKFKKIIKAYAEGVPNDIAANLDDVLHSESFSVSYTSPAQSSGDFVCSSYSAEPDEGSHESGSIPEWNVSFTIESAQPKSSGDGL